MTTAYTSLLGFALPVTGELNGTWGNVVNNSITQLVEDSVAGQATASVASGDWTLTTTGSGAANQARCAILIPTGSPGVSRNIIAPSSSKAYVVINQSDAAVVIKGTATTGVTIAAGIKALVAWNGSDFVQVGNSGTVTAVSVATANGLAGTSSGGTTPALTLSTTVTGVLKGNGTAISAAAAGTDYVAPGGALGTPSSGTLTNCSGLSLTTGVSGTLPITSGGTGQTTASAAFNALSPVTTTGDLIIGNGSNSSTRLPIGTNGYLLQSNGTTASWQPAPATGISQAKVTALAMTLGF